MERHKSLYKENSSYLSPREHNRIIRERQNVLRAKSRNNNFQNNRRISESPPPTDLDSVPLSCVTSTPAQIKPAENKGNTAEWQTSFGNATRINPEMVERDVNKENSVQLQTASRIAKVAAIKDSNTLKRGEIYLKRYVEWKDAKKKELFQKQQLKRKVNPLQANAVNADKGINSNGFNFKSSHFKPPVGLQDVKKDQVTNNVQEFIPLRKSLYTIVPITKKVKPDEDKNKNVVNALRTKAVIPSANTRSVAAAKQLTDPLPLGSCPKVNKPTAQVVAKKTQPSTTSKTTINNIVKRADIITKSTNAVVLQHAEPKTTKTITKPRTLFLPPPLPVAASKKGNNAQTIANRCAVKVAIKSIVGQPKPLSKQHLVAPANGAQCLSNVRATGAIGKAKEIQRQRIVKNTINAHKTIKLSMNLKAKKPANIDISGNQIQRQLKTTSKLNENKIYLALQAQKIETIAETPTDFNLANKFDLFITSTKQKTTNSEVNEQFFNKISPIEGTEPDVLTSKRSLSGSSSAKRNLLEQVPSSKQIKANNKFNFIRYSEAASEIDITIAPATNDLPEKTSTDMVDNDNTLLNARNPKDCAENDISDKTLVNSTAALGELQTTPDKTNDRPANYMSPFVSVSRGKVNLKTERERRNSIYLQNDNKLKQTDAEKLEQVVRQDSGVIMETMDVEKRRGLETVRYFRQQLRDEISRLNVLCEKWEEYKDENLSRLQEMDGEDMINVAIGQTKLLTTKKLAQFGSLINRCEAGLIGNTVGVAPNDGSEDTKPIHADDLHGWWDMVSLQCENIDKRFANLERWKANGWSDPDEKITSAEAAPPPSQKIVSKLNKVKKAKTTLKAKPSSSLSQMLRKNIAEMRKKKAAEAAATDDIILPNTSNQNRQSLSESSNGSPGRFISVVVRDRKLYSAAATVVFIPSPKSSSRSSLTDRRSFIMSESPAQNLASLHQEKPSMLKSALFGAVDSKRRQSMKSNTPKKGPSVSRTRKSILKTPGTPRCNSKNVNFDDKKYIRKFKFTYEEKENLGDTDEGEESTEVSKENKNVDSPNNSTDEPNDSPRMYRLRNRKVVLRPSIEIIIPR